LGSKIAVLPDQSLLKPPGQRYCGNEKHRHDNEDNDLMSRHIKVLFSASNSGSFSAFRI
jgi:hypothetical protein